MRKAHFRGRLAWAALAVIKHVPLTGHPNNIDIGKDGKKVYVSIRDEPGAVDVIDTVKQQRVNSIRVEGGVHNTYVTPDGKSIVFDRSRENSDIVLIDLPKEE